MKYENPFTRFGLALLAATALASVSTPVAFSDDDAGEIEKQEALEAKSSTSAETWASEVKTKYTLTDDQMKAMQTAGIKGPGLAITAELAKASGKTIEEVSAMRTTEKMGWGKIAKTLGVPPGSIGQSVSSLHRASPEKKEERREAKEERKAAKEERKLRRQEAKEERRAAKEERKEERASKAKHGH